MQVNDWYTSPWINLGIDSPRKLATKDYDDSILNQIQ